MERKTLDFSEWAKISLTRTKSLVLARWQLCLLLSLDNLWRNQAGSGRDSVEHWINVIEGNVLMCVRILLSASYPVNSKRGFAKTLTHIQHAKDFDRIVRSTSNTNLGQSRLAILCRLLHVVAAYYLTYVLAVSAGLLAWLRVLWGPSQILRIALWYSFLRSSLPSRLHSPVGDVVGHFEVKAAPTAQADCHVAVSATVEIIDALEATEEGWSKTNGNSLIRNE